MGCKNDCFGGTLYAKRNVNVEGSLEFITIFAQKFADLEQKNIVIYVRDEIGKGKFYDFEPEAEGRANFKKLIKFHREDSSKDILPNFGNKRPKPSKSEKDKDKSGETEQDLV
jgi:hypothetical protein